MAEIRTLTANAPQASGRLLAVTRVSEGGWFGLIERADGRREVLPLVREDASTVPTAGAHVTLTLRRIHCTRGGELTYGWVAQN